MWEMQRPAASAAAAPSTQPQVIADVHFRLHRLRAVKEVALQLLRKHRPASQPSDCSPPNPSLTPSSSLPQPTLTHPLPAPLQAYIEQLQSQRWSEHARASLSSTYLAYHASAVLTLVKARALQREADTSTPLSPAAALSLISRLHDLHSEWEVLEQQRAALLHRHSYGCELQLSIIPPSPFPSPLVVQRITTTCLSSLSTALSSPHPHPPLTPPSFPSPLQPLLDQWTPVLHSLTRLHHQQQTALHRLFTTAHPFPHLCGNLPTLLPLTQPLPLPSHLDVLTIIGHAVCASLCASSPSTSLLSLTTTARSLHQQLTGALLPWVEGLQLPLFPSSLSPSQYLHHVVSSTATPLTPGGAVIPLPWALSLTADEGRGGVLYPVEATLKMRPLLCEEERFQLYQQGPVYAQMSALRQALTKATHQPPPPSDCRDPIVSGYVSLLRRLLVILPPLSLDSHPSLRHCHTSLISLLTQSTQQSIEQHSSLQGGHLGPALLLHSDLSHIIHALGEHRADGCQSLQAARTRLTSACVEHCAGWLLEQEGIGFGHRLKRFPLVLPSYPSALPTAEVAQLLQPSSAIPQLLVSPYLSLYLQWFVPLLQLVQRLHPATQAMLPRLLDAFHLSLLTFLSSLLHTRARINANGTTLLTREVDYIDHHTSTLTWPDLSQSQGDAGVVQLRAALHVLALPELYRAALPGKQGGGAAATVAPMLPAGKAETGVRLPGHSVAEWKDWLGIVSNQHHKAWKAGVQREGEELSEAKEANPFPGCGCWRSNSVAAAPVPAAVKR